MAKKIERQAREEGVEDCPECKTYPLPRGYDINTGLCWFCIRDHLKLTK